MRNKGFTLIELLAVIVILAIIALIATPIVLNIISDSKEKSKLRSAENYVTAVEQAIADKNLKIEYKPDTCKGSNAKELTCSLNGVEYTDKLSITVDGDLPDYVYIVFDVEKGKTTSTLLKYNDQKVTLSNGTYVINDIVAPSSFETDSWDTIATAFILGTYKNIYKVEDTKEVDMGDLGTHTVRISNLSTSDECKTEGYSQTACGVVIEFEDIITTHVMNSTDTNVGGWKDSEMRTYLNNDVYNEIKDETLKNAIINTYVVSSHGSSDTSNFVTTDKLYLLAMTEVWGTSWINNQYKYIDTAKTTTRQLDYYNEEEIDINTNYTGAVKKFNGVETKHWLRTSDSLKSDSFLNVGFYKVFSLEENATNTYGVSPAFRLAS